MNNIYYANPSSEISPSSSYRLKINGEDIFVYQCAVASYCPLSGTGKLDVEIEALFDFSSVKIRPLSKGINFKVNGRKICFTLNAPAKISVELDGDIRNPLFIFVNPPETEKPDPSDPKVKYFTGGKVYDAGEIIMNEGETLYVEEGAFVYGNVVAHKADNIKILGRGIMCGSKIDRKDRSKVHQMVKVVQSKNLTIDGVTFVDGPNWHIVPIACENVTITNLNIITFKGTGDGIDIAGDENVTVKNCFVRSMDDCITMKAVHYQDPAGCKNVRNVHVSDCVFWNAEWGNAIEIGYETRAEEIRDITFEDIDVIRCEFEGYESGGTFTIHNGDRAVVSNVLYNNIRVEDSREKLIDIKILFSKYSKDAERGQVRDIRFKDIKIVDGAFPVSVIRGYDGNHMIENVTIENFTVYGQKITNATDAKMVVELSKNVKFI